MMVADNWKKHPERVVGKWFHYPFQTDEFIFIVQHNGELRFDYGMMSRKYSAYYLNGLAKLTKMEEAVPPDTAPQGIIRAIFEGRIIEDEQ
jgi:hypothetical protein